MCAPGETSCAAVGTPRPDSGFSYGTRAEAGAALTDVTGRACGKLGWTSMPGHAIRARDHRDYAGAHLNSAVDELGLRRNKGVRVRGIVTLLGIVRIGVPFSLNSP